MVRSQRLTMGFYLAASAMLHSIVSVGLSIIPFSQEDLSQPKDGGRTLKTRIVQEASLDPDIYPTEEDIELLIRAKERDERLQRIYLKYGQELPEEARDYPWLVEQINEINAFNIKTEEWGEMWQSRFDELGQRVGKLEDTFKGFKERMDSTEKLMANLERRVDVLINQNRSEKTEVDYNGGFEFTEYLSDYLQMEDTEDKLNDISPILEDNRGKYVVYIHIEFREGKKARYRFRMNPDFEDDNGRAERHYTKLLKRAIKNFELPLELEFSPYGVGYKLLNRTDDMGVLDVITD